MSWIESHEPLIALALQALMVVIWIAYLQIIVMGVLHQRRPVVLIHRSAGLGDGARCFVSNMGGEPIYLISMVAEVTVDGETRRAFVTDREEHDPDDLSTPAQGTAQGPISSGGMNDVGSFGDLVWRSLRQTGQEQGEVTHLRLTALCASGHSAHLVAGRRDFRVGRRDGSRGFVPVQVTTEQVGSWFQRRALRKLLEDDLAHEAEVTLDRSGS